MMKLKKENYDTLKKMTLAEIAFNLSDDPIRSRMELENAIKTITLLYIAHNQKPYKHQMESTVVQTLQNSSDWFRTITTQEYPDEVQYSKKKIDISNYLE